MDEHDPVVEVIPGKLWQSGSRAPQEGSTQWDAVVAVGEGWQAWVKPWMEAGWQRLERGKPRLPVFLHAPLVDARGMLDAPTAAAVARLVANLVSTGRRVLVHCDAGHFRSVFVAALVVGLLHRERGSIALGRVRKAQGRAISDGIGIPDYDDMLAQWPADSAR